MNKTIWKRSAVVLGALTVAVAGWPGISIGNDGKVTGPSVCRRSGTSNALGLQYTADAVTNVSGTSLQVNCSLLRDNTGNTNGLADLEIAVTDPTNGGSVICDAMSLNRDGVIQKSVRKSSTRLGSQLIDFGAALNVSSSKGSYLISCFLPNGGRIQSVFSDEF